MENTSKAMMIFLDFCGRPLLSLAGSTVVTWSPVISGRHVSPAVSESWGQAELSKKYFPGSCHFCMLSPHCHSIDRGHTDICIFVKAYIYFVI